MTQEASSKDLSYRRIASLTGPILLANLAVICSGTIDTVMAGRLSSEQMAGVALGMAVASFIAVSLSDVLQGVSPIAGYYFGAKRFQSVGESLYQTLFLALIVSVPGVLLTLASPLWTALSGMSTAGAKVAEHYLWGAAGALPAILLSRGFVAINAATSRPKMTMMVTLLILVLKVPVNAVLMYGALGLAPMGGAGAGVSTALLSWLGLFAYMAIWRFDPYFRALRVGVALRWNTALVKRLLKVGLPIGVAGSAEMGAFSAMTLFLARLGDDMMAAHQIVANLVYLLYVVPFSIGLAGTVLVSQSLGEGRRERARRVSNRILRVALVCAGVMALLVYVGREVIVRGYTNEPHVAAIALTLFGWAALYHMADAIQIAATSLLRGYQMTFLPMLIHAFGLCGVALSLGAVLCYTDWLLPPMGLTGFWIGACVGLSLAAAFMTPLLRKVARESA